MSAKWEKGRVHWDHIATFAVKVVKVTKQIAWRS